MEEAQHPPILGVGGGRKAVYRHCSSLNQRKTIAGERSVWLKFLTIHVDNMQVYVVKQSKAGEKNQRRDCLKTDSFVGCPNDNAYCLVM